MSTKRTMMKHTLKEWVAVTRYWSFPVSAMPVAVCFAYLFSRGLVPDGTMPWFCLLLSLLGIVVLHAAGTRGHTHLRISKY